MGAVVKKHKHIYNDRRWPILRKECWRLANGLCAKCGKQVKTWGDRYDPHYYECDHIIPLDEDEGLAFEIDNLQCLHRKCHRAKQDTDNHHHIKGCDINGMPLAR